MADHEPELAPPQEEQEQQPRASSDPRGMGEATLIDYWFDLSESGGQKTCVTYAYGMEIDRRSGDSSSTAWTDLMAAALPAIQADVDAYGIAP